jgi:hypothetical protein
MKKYLLLFSFFVLFVSASFSQKVITIRELQEVPQDSLVKLDQYPASSMPWLDDSKYFRYKTDDGDTITVTGVVIVKPRVLTYTLARYNIFIQDTTGKVWAGLNVLTGDTSAQAQGTLITALDSGWVVTITGKVEEYSPTSPSNSLTEMWAYSPTYFPVANPIQVLGVGKRPDAIEVKISDFISGGKIMFSTGEKYESMYCIIKDVVVSSVASDGSGRFNIMDAAGNEMTVYDGSAWYTLRSHKNTSSKYTAPPVGTRLAYVRGVIVPQLNAYNIMPLYPGKDQQTTSTYAGDIKIDKYSPAFTVSRNPIVVTPNDDVIAKAIVTDNNPSGKIDSIFFNYQIGTNKLVTVKLNAGDSTYTIPKQAEGTTVKYFFSAYNNLGLKGISPDTSKAWAFYTSKAKLSIYDVRYTPYNDGRSAYYGGTVTVGGIVTADTSDIPGATGTPKVYFQSGTGGWSGINLYGSGTYAPEMKKVKRGDSITVTGKIDEYSGRNEIVISAPVIIVSSGNAVPAASLITLSGSSSVAYQLANMPVSGSRNIEQWEGVLIKVNNGYVTNTNCDGPTGHYGEWFIASALTGSSATYGLRVNDDGAYTYYWDTDTSSTGYTVAKGKPANGKMLPLNTKIGTLTGIIDYVNSQYKIEPRKMDDFTDITNSIEKLSNTPEAYTLAQNYPNPFNPSTTIIYSLPASSKVSLVLYNTLGQKVLTLVDQVQNAGKYQVNLNGSSLSSGVYFYQIRTADYIKTMKMILMK